MTNSLKNYTLALYYMNNTKKRREIFNKNKKKQMKFEFNSYRVYEVIVNKKRKNNDTRC